MNISIVGGGSMGTGVAAHLASLGHKVHMWVREPEVVEGINNERRNHIFLKDITLPEGIKAFNDMESALRDAEVVIMAVPSRWTREVCKTVASFIDPKADVLNLAKGFDYSSDQRLSVIIADELKTPNRIAVMSGPNLAEEIAKKLPSTTVIASKDNDLSKTLQREFSSDYFRVYTNSDVIGVEIGGAYKNIVAIAAGILDGLGLGDNTKASLIARGLAEMVSFGSAMGANPITFSGLSGIGDMIATGISKHSRNRTFGEKLGKGKLPHDALDDTVMVVEGVYATRSVIRMTSDLGVEIPIARGVHEVLEGRSEPSGMVDMLMTRELKEEIDESIYRDFLLKNK
jgi:glycerol-3-phosphate dehydrogenase (NAD(P)+)